MGKLIKNITAVLILAFLVWYLSGHRDQLKMLMQMNPANIALLYLATIAGTVNNSRVIQILIRLFSHAPGLWEMVILQNASRLLNYVPMKFRHFISSQLSQEEVWADLYPLYYCSNFHGFIHCF